MDRRIFLGSLGALLASPVQASTQSAAAIAKSVTPRLVDGLSISNEDGVKLPLENWQGRWVLIALWSPWCLPCRDEMPMLERLSEKLDPERTQVLPLAFDERGSRWVRKFYREVGIERLPVYLGIGENVDKVLGLSALPSAALINPFGEHVATVTGTAVWDDAATLAWLQGLNA